MKITITSLLFFFVMIVELASAGTLLHNGANLPSLRDNTTLTDAGNVLKYLQVLGFPSNKIAATDTVGTFIIFSNRTEANTTAMTKTVSYCYRNYGHSFYFTHYKYDYFPSGISYMAKLGDATVNHTDLPHFRNNKRLTTQELNAFQHPIVEFQ